MRILNRNPILRLFRVLFALISGLLIVASILIMASSVLDSVAATPIKPPEGYPKFNISTEVIAPTIAKPGDGTLQYISSTLEHAQLPAQCSQT